MSDPLPQDQSEQQGFRLASGARPVINRAAEVQFAPRPSRLRPVLKAAAGPLLIVAAFGGMLLWTWNMWPDVLVDFGDQCYIPWRIGEGEVLYRDIAYYNGPLSQYFNALCFRVFGPGLQTLVFCNIALVLALLALFHYALRQISRPYAATTACLLFVMLFACAQNLGIGNYNFICPYSHEMTHGLLLGLLALVLAWPAARWGLLCSGLSGFVLGLAFLTKAEVFLPAAVGVGAALALGSWSENLSWRQRFARCACFAAAFPLAPAAAFVSLASAMPAAQAFQGVLGSWVVTMRSDLVGLPFFREGMGLNQPAEHIGAMLKVTAIYALIFAPAAGLGWALRWPGRYRTVVAGVVFGVAVGVLSALYGYLPWFDLARPFPLFLLITAVAVTASFVGRRGDPAARRRFAQQMSFLVFALLLLAKVILNVRVFHYGFVLALPAALLLCVAACDWAPAWVERHGGSGRPLVAVVLALLAVVVVRYHRDQARLMVMKTCVVGAGADEFLTDERGRLVNSALAELKDKYPRGMTMAVLPEGSMVNYLGWRKNPTRYMHLMPVELMLFGEDRVLADFEAHAPDLIVLAHRDTTEFGFPLFGQDYAKKLGDWIKANYQTATVLGEPPLKTNKGFGIAILERKGLTKTKP